MSYVGHMTAETTATGVIPHWTLADKIRKAREHAGLSQQELAEQLSVTRTSVVNWERGHTRPLRPIVRLLAEATRVDPDWLQTGDMDGNDPNPLVTGKYRAAPDHSADPITQPSVAEIKSFIRRGVNRTGVVHVAGGDGS